MKRFASYIFIFIGILYNLTIYASETSNEKDGGEPEKEPTEQVIVDKSQLMLSKIYPGDHVNVGGLDIINMLIDNARALEPQIEKLKCLEVGSGLGKTTYYMQQSGFSHITGIDINPEAIEYSKQNYSSIEFVQADVNEITDIFEEEYFSLIYMLNVAEEIKDKATMMQKVKNICQNNGIFVIFGYEYKEGNDPTSLKILEELSIHPLKLSEIKMLARGVGWEVAKIEDISANYKQWHQSALNDISERKETLMTNDFTQEEVDLALKNLQNKVHLITENKLGGVLIILKKI